MNRPVAIQRFEQLYLASIAAQLFAGILAWNNNVEAFAARVPQAANSAGLYVGGSIAGLILILLVLWFFVARSGSVVAKWLVTLLAAYQVIAAGYDLLQGNVPVGAAGWLTLVSVLLSAVAAWFLFRSEAKPWFARAAGPAA